MLCGAGVLHENTAGAAVAAGVPVATGAAGTVGPGANAIGLAVRAVTAADITAGVPLRWLAFR